MGRQPLQVVTMFLIWQHHIESLRHMLHLQMHVGTEYESLLSIKGADVK
jgi:hypothetical protein